LRKAYQGGRKATGSPVVLVGDRQKFRTFPRFINDTGLLSQLRGRASISTRPILGRFGDFHWHSGCWLDAIDRVSNTGMNCGSVKRITQPPISPIATPFP
jgi:hypothetical protein